LCCACFALVRAVCFALARLFFRCKTSTSITRGAHHINHDREGVGKKNAGEFFTTPSFQEAGSKGRGLGDQHGDQVHRTTPLFAVHTVHIDCSSYQKILPQKVGDLLRPFVLKKILPDKAPPNSRSWTSFSLDGVHFGLHPRTGGNNAYKACVAQPVESANVDHLQ